MRSTPAAAAARDRARTTTGAGAILDTLSRDPELESLLGALALRDEAAYCARSRRLEFERVEIVDDKGVRDELGLVHVDRPAVLGSALPDLGVAVEGPITLVGGGLAQWQFAAHVPVLHQRPDRLARLLEPAMKAVAARRSRAVALYLRPGDAPVVEAAFGPEAALSEADPWCVLDVPPVQTVEEFLATLPGRRRRTWQHDIAVARRQDLIFEAEPLEAGIVPRIAPLVAAVAGRNGAPPDVEFSAWRLRSLLDQPGRHLVVSVAHEGAEVGVAVCRAYERYCAVHTVGLDDRLPRRDLYHATTFYGPLMTALREGYRHLGMGTTHVQPKAYRGCHVDRRLRLVGPA